LMALCEICSWVETRRYDCVVVDTAPSGDTLRLLAMPELIRRWLGMLEVLLGKRRYLRRVFDRSGGPEHLDFLGTGWKATLQLTEKLLRDPARTQFVLVTTADPASIRETAALWKDFETQRMPVSQLVVNQLHLECYCPPCKAAEAAELLEIEQLVEAVEDSCPVWGVGLQPDGVDGRQRTMEFWDRAHPMDRRPQIAARDN